MNNLVIKIYEEGCSQCLAMHSVERAATEEYGTEFLFMTLEFAAQHQNIYDYVASHVVDGEGNVELPIYLFLDENDTITGHHVGIGTYHEISPFGDLHS